LGLDTENILCIVTSLAGQYSGHTLHLEAATAGFDFAPSVGVTMLGESDFASAGVFFDSLHDMTIAIVKNSSPNARGAVIKNFCFGICIMRGFGDEEYL